MSRNVVLPTERLLVLVLLGSLCLPAEALSFEPIRLNSILFKNDSSELLPEGKVEADKLVTEMKKYPKDTVVFVGHTDDVGSTEYNLALSRRRAEAVRDYVISQGIAPERLSIEAKGESEPALPNDTPTNRVLNRRVSFKYNVTEARCHCDVKKTERETDRPALILVRSVPSWLVLPISPILNACVETRRARAWL